MNDESGATAFRGAVVAAIVLGCIYPLRIALLPFLIAGAIALVLHPLSARLRRAGWGRITAGLAVFMGFIVLASGLGYLLAELIGNELLSVAGRGSAVIEALIRELGGTIHLFGREIDLGQMAQQLLDEAQRRAGTDVLRVAGVGFATFLGLVLSLVLLFYFLISGPRLAEGVVWLAPPRYRADIRMILSRIVPAWRRYVAGVFMVVAYAMALAWVGYGFFFRLPHAGLLSFAVGLLEVVPVLGPIASGILVGVIAIEQSDVSAVAVFGYAIALRLSIDQLFGPLVLGRAVRLHPVIVLFAFLAAGTVFGVTGVLLAVPAAAAIKISLAYFYDDAKRD